jgi:hypothetical protein|tara:strand:- start:1918 stop:3390 length:1473 start_codon:yes stop_codon:yes gene_type:complete
MAAIIEVKYFNSFILRKVMDGDGNPMWNGSKGDNTMPQGAVPNNKEWFAEEARIKGGYNNTSVSFGAKAYLIEEEPNASRRSNALIYSGIFNSRTGINNTNVFSVGEDITKAVDPANGSIQKLYAEDTNLIVFQESKVNRALIDKDAIYSAEGQGSVTSTNLVIGQIVPYAGNYGISRNPESFAVFGYRKYFTDKDRNAVLRLSQDGLTEISAYGMKDFFRDQLTTLDSGNLTGKAYGGWDNYTKQYVLSLQPANSNKCKTLSYDEEVRGWTSFYSYKPVSMFSLKGYFYTVPKDPSYLNTQGETISVNKGVYRHNASDLNVNRATFYGEYVNPSITFIFNPNPSTQKNFKTISYEGSNGWQVESFTSDPTGKGIPDYGQPQNYDIVETNDTTQFIYSYNEGAYDSLGNSYPGQLVPPIYHAGFDRQENRYVANLINSSSAAPGEISFGGSITGIKGYFATVKMSVDSSTDFGKMKELFAVSSEFVASNY